VCDKFVGYFLRCSPVATLDAKPRRGGLVIEEVYPPEALAPAGRHERSYGAPSILGSVDL